MKKLSFCGAIRESALFLQLGIEHFMRFNVLQSSVFQCLAQTQHIKNVKINWFSE